MSGDDLAREQLEEGQRLYRQWRDTEHVGDEQINDKMAAWTYEHLDVLIRMALRAESTAARHPPAQVDDGVREMVDGLRYAATKTIDGFWRTIAKDAADLLESTAARLAEAERRLAKLPKEPPLGQIQGGSKPEF